jgi:NADH dehydrogenase/NADH:ubiquinone oxidoreductase subunit G
LLVGTNPRYEAPLLNSRIRKGFLHHELDIGVVGPKLDLNYEYEVFLVFKYQVPDYSSVFVALGQHDRRSEAAG